MKGLSGLYSLALGVGLVAASPVLAARLAQGRYRRTASARLGLGSAWLPPSRPGALWVHALSVGEVRSALPLLKGMGRRFPERPLAFSVATAQGMEVAREALAGLPEITLFMRPLDLPWSVERLLDRLRPGLFCLVEGDIWPNWQWSLARRGVPRMLVNSRVSPRTFRGYQRFAPLARELFRGFDRVLAQTQVDMDRLLAVGVEPERLSVAGNLKFDSAPAFMDHEQRQALSAELGLSGRTVLAAGSTHPGEEEPCLEAFLSLRGARPDLTLLLAPREVGRGKALARLATERGLKAACLSQGAPSEGCEVVVLDVLGRLAQAYGLAAAAFVGGSLVGVGGHNLLEPAAQGVPVIFGPHTHNFLEMAQGLIEAGGGRRIAKGHELAQVWGELLDDPARAAQMGESALAFCRAHRGALERALTEAARLIEAP